jgi:hypothetical protein
VTNNGHAIESVNAEIPIAARASNVAYRKDPFIIDTRITITDGNPSKYGINEIDFKLPED